MPSMRSITPLLLALAGGGCGVPIPDFETGEGGTGSTEAAETTADASTGGGASATSTTGRTSTSSDTALEPSTTDAGDDTGGTFVPPPGCPGSDDGFQVRCTPATCDIWEQDCASGEKCVPWANDGGNAWNDNRCAPIPDDPAALGEPCVALGSPVTGLDDCELGALCFGVDPRTLQGTCVALCDEDDPATCPDGEVCVAHDDYRPQVCLARCDPTDSATCPAGESCRPIGDELLCVPSVTLPQGLSCGSNEQYCAVEQACVSAEALADCTESACCTAWCDLSAPDPDLPCAAVPGEVCRPYLEPAPAGQEHVGVCGLAP